MFLVVILGKSLCQKSHIKHIENEIAKNICLLFKARPFLNKKSLLSIQHQHIHSYINYGTVSSGSTCRTNFKKIKSRQKHALRIIFGKSKFERTSELFKCSKVLNVYVLKIFNTAVFMHKIPEKSMLNIFLLKFRRHSHSHTTRFSHVICVNPIPKLNDCKYKILTEDHFSGTTFPHHGFTNHRCL